MDGASRVAGRDNYCLGHLCRWSCLEITQIHRIVFFWPALNTHPWSFVQCTGSNIPNIFIMLSFCESRANACLMLQVRSVIASEARCYQCSSVGYTATILVLLRGILRVHRTSQGLEEGNQRDHTAYRLWFVVPRLQQYTILLPT